MPLGTLGQPRVISFLEIAGTGVISIELSCEDCCVTVLVVKMSHQIHWRFEASLVEANSFIDRLS